MDGDASVWDLKRRIFQVDNSFRGTFLFYLMLDVFLVPGSVFMIGDTDKRIKWLAEYHDILLYQEYVHWGAYGDFYENNADLWEQIPETAKDLRKYGPAWVKARNNINSELVRRGVFAEGGGWHPDFEGFNPPVGDHDPA